MTHRHKWTVFSTCLGTLELMVQCTGCGAFGTVPEPTQEEWSRAFHAPSAPYEWGEPERVVLHEQHTPTMWRRNG